MYTEKCDIFSMEIFLRMGRKWLKLQTWVQNFKVMFNNFHTMDILQEQKWYSQIKKLYNYYFITLKIIKSYSYYNFPVLTFLHNTLWKENFLKFFEVITVPHYYKDHNVDSINNRECIKQPKWGSLGLSWAV